MLIALKAVRSYYDILGVSSSADAATLRKAFHVKTMELHPDTTSLPQEEAAEKFQLVCEAYELLGDATKRGAYDKDLANSSLIDQKLVDPSHSLNYLDYVSKSRIKVLRPLSGGELLSLILLGLVLFLSLFLAVAVAYLKGGELQSYPSWLIY